MKRYPRRIAFDAAPAISQPTGVGIYTSELGASLAGLAPDRIAFIGVRLDGPLVDYAKRVAGLTYYARGRRRSWMQLRADADARTVGAHIVHYTNMYAPLRVSLPFVLTIQDLSVIRFPQYHPWRRVAMAPVMIAAARRALALIVPSIATKLEVERFLRISPDRIAVVPLAARSTSSSAIDHAHDRALLQRLGVQPRQYILSLGTLEPRKNHAMVVRAFERLTNDGAFGHLVLAGARGWHSQRLMRLIAASPARHRIVLPGYVTEDVRQALLRHCSVFVYLSTYEGFGLPVVEAMAAGAVVVTSSSSSLPEAAGGAAVLTEPSDLDAVERAINRAWSRRDELVSAGLNRARSRTWRDVAEDTLEVYDRCLDQAAGSASEGKIAE